MDSVPLVMSDAFNQKCLFFHPPTGSLQPAPRQNPCILPTAPHLRLIQRPTVSALWLQGRHQPQGDEGGGTSIHLITLSNTLDVYVKLDRKALRSMPKCIMSYMCIWYDLCVYVFHIEYSAVC